MVRVTSPCSTLTRRNSSAFESICRNFDDNDRTVSHSYHIVFRLFEMLAECHPSHTGLETPPSRPRRTWLWLEEDLEQPASSTQIVTMDRSTCGRYDLQLITRSSERVA